MLEMRCAPSAEGFAKARLAVKPQCAQLDRENAGVSLVLVAAFLVDHLEAGEA